MKLSRAVLAALLALPLAGAGLAAEEPAGQAGIERTPPGAEALSPEVAPPLPDEARPPSAAPDAAPDASRASAADVPADKDAAGAPADRDSATVGDMAPHKADASGEGGADSGKDTGSPDGAASAEKDGHAADGEHALGEKEAAPVQDDDPALDRAREPVAPPAAEPASSAI